MNDHERNATSFVGTQIKIDGQIIKALATPGVIRTDEPNEVHVELFKSKFFERKFNSKRTSFKIVTNSHFRWKNSNHS